MPRSIPVLVTVLSLAGPVSLSAAQGLRAQVPEMRQASSSGGRIHGVVRDEAGQTVGGANIIAMGTTLASVQSDLVGRFVLSLPPGEYVLRATREGYISTYREPVRVQTSGTLERNIVLVRQDAAPSGRPVMLAGTSFGAVASDGELVEPPADADHSHSDAIWRLRHLARTVLRETAPATAPDGATRDADEFRQAGWFLDRALAESARAASAFFSDTDFNGQVNFLTTSSSTASSGWLPRDWPRGVADVAVGASVGTHGDWMVRGAMNPGDLSSWLLLGEYQARADLTHAFNIGVSYSAQGFVTSQSAPRVLDGSDTRNVGGLYGSDRWTLSPTVALDYGLRFDHYDYVTGPDLVSPRLTVRVAVTPRTFVTTTAAQRMIAPGADEFLPPTSAGLLLPPERTFSPVVAGAPMEAERVRHYEVGLEREFGPSDRLRSISVSRFQQSSADQLATIFGARAEAVGTGHYFVAAPGSVLIEGWAVRLEGWLAPGVEGRVTYVTAESDWSPATGLRAVRRLAPSVTRRGLEHLHDLTTSIEARIPETSTRLTFFYRVNSAFSAGDRASRVPGLGGRFEFEVHQALPYELIRGSRLELVFAARNLFHNLGDGVSIYDELLTVAPPLRLMGGVQVRF
jgi:outer membrane receptor protein involved in Fe transport